MDDVFTMRAAGIDRQDVASTMGAERGKVRFYNAQHQAGREVVRC
jgi:hypothetical protein